MPGIPADITIAGRTPATIKGNLPPLINTAEAARGGFRAGDDAGGGLPYNPVGVIYSENFNSQPDYHNLMYTSVSGQSASAGTTLPVGFDFLYQQDDWNPENGDSDKGHSLEILAANSDKARGGSGKSIVFHRESYSASKPSSGDTVSAGSWIRIFHTAGSTAGETKTSTVTANGQTYTFSSTTASSGSGTVRPDPVANATDFNDFTDCAPGRGLRSNAIQITTTGPVTNDYGDFEISANGTTGWSGWNNFASDAQLIKVLDADYDEMYVEFWIRFSDNWFHRTGDGPWMSKMFRMGSWSREGNPFNGAGGEVGPRFFYDYRRDAYGVRNVIGLYEGPHGAGGPVITGTRGSLNYTGSTTGKASDGGNPEIPDLVNGGFIYNSANPVSHEQLYGPTETWTKLGFYVKMNSAPGVADGVLRQWINDEQFHVDSGITWITDDNDVNPTQKMVGWNYFAIGGNDYFQEFPNFDQFEDWWAADDIVIRDSIPENLL